MDGASCPLLSGDQGLGTGPERRSPGQPHLWPCQGRPWQVKDEHRLQLQNSASWGRDPNPRPLTQARAQKPPSEEGRGRYSLSGGRPEGAGRPNPPARALRAGAGAGPPPSSPAAGLGPPKLARPLPAGRPAGLAPLPALTHATPGAVRPRPFYTREHRRTVPRIQPLLPTALTRCLRRSAALCVGRRSPPHCPRRSQRRSPQPSLSRPHPDPLWLSLFSHRNCSPALRPSSSASLPLNNSLHAPGSRHRLPRRAPGCEVAAAVPGGKEASQRAAPTPAPAPAWRRGDGSGEE
ncbi:hypothetical protein P7K49_002798 [Saguinus oedipus]|uniref:Uncharacterized protein n=1 Tax=Saguinus oedipus TaxID=9490 RepID=A0ABQ9WIC5_SAGOE|nr:hypothetical protein P7K49_002798 [Saguinus oedipus]